jgi:MFS transporter, DHA1 family, inner membrane transport protein
MLSSTSESRTGLRRHAAVLFILSAGGFTSALNVTLLSPLIVQIADQFGVSEAAAGQLATLTAACAGLMGILVAPWMDRYSRRFWFRLECSMLATGTILSAIAPEFGWMFLGRILCGLGGAVIGANCLATCGDLFPEPAERNRAIGLVNSAFTLGAVFGLPIVAMTADLTSWRVAIAIPAPLAIAVLIGTRRIPATVRPAEGSIWTAWRAGYRRVIRSRETVWLLASEILLQVVWFGWLIYFGAFTDNVYGITAALLSLLFFVGGGAEILANNLTPILTRNRSIAAVAYPAVAIQAINLLMIGIAHNREWSMFPFIAIGSFSGALIFICLNIALLDSLPSDPGAVMSLMSASLELGGSLGVALTGLSLALLDDFETVYRLLGAVAPLIAITFWLSTRNRSASREVVAAPGSV